MVILLRRQKLSSQVGEDWKLEWGWEKEGLTKQETGC